MKRFFEITIVFLGLVLAFAGGAIAGGQSRGVDDAKQAQSNFAKQESILTLVNNVRTANGVAALVDDPALDKTARIKADDMALNNYRTHDRPDGESWTMLFYREYSPNVLVGENLAECQTSPEQIISEWVASPGHKATMLDARMTKFGAASVYDADQQCFITVNHFSE